jgi:hypothetical protein
LTKKVQFFNQSAFLRRDENHFPFFPPFPCRLGFSYLFNFFFVSSFQEEGKVDYRESAAAAAAAAASESESE